MDNPFSGPSLPEPRKSVFGHLANFLLLFPNRALSKDSWNKGPCSLSRRFLLEPKRMPEPGPCFQETNRTATPRLYCEGAVMMLSNTHMHKHSLLPFGKPSGAIPACDFHVTQICAMVFTPPFHKSGKWSSKEIQDHQPGSPTYLHIPRSPFCFYFYFKK